MDKGTEGKTPGSPLQKCFDGESHDQIRQIKEPDRGHIPEIRHGFGDAELADRGRSQPE